MPAGGALPIFASVNSTLDEMGRRVLRHASGGGRDLMLRRSAIPNLGIAIVHRPTVPMSTVYDPMVCLVLQGAKVVMIGDQVLRYDPASCFIASLELPATGRVVEASADKPYVGLGLRIDRDALAGLMTEMEPRPEAGAAAFAVTPVTPDLLEAWAHLLALLDAPGDVPMLAPLREREILYRLLQGPQGGLLRQIMHEDSRLARVRRAVLHIKAHFQETLRVEALAEIAAMSVPSFHRHFKAATAMSPLQYQKTLRLLEARRLLLASADASRAAYSVGYESASQFSREYARMFGAPPSRDAVRLRATAEGVGEQVAI